MRRCHRPWTDAELARLVRDYPDTPTPALAKQMRRSIGSVYGKASALGLRKSDAFFASPASGRLTPGDTRGLAGRFQKGQRGWNKGKSYQPGGRAAETQFKPGHRGGKAVEISQPIGAERMTKDGYRQRKVNDDMPLLRRWKMLHVIAWEENNGPAPKGHAIVFRDGDRSNCDISNLELVTRRELLARNSIHRYPEELQEVMRLKGQVTRRIRKRTRHAEQD
jgi:hypothetical protein